MCGVSSIGFCLVRHYVSTTLSSGRMLLRGWLLSPWEKGGKKGSTAFGICMRKWMTSNLASDIFDRSLESQSNTWPKFCMNFGESCWVLFIKKRPSNYGLDGILVHSRAQLYKPQIKMNPNWGYSKHLISALLQTWAARNHSKLHLRFIRQFLERLR